MKDRVILLVDMNSFFASVEQRCNPLLRGKPVLVGGPAKSRSVVSTASYEARPFGVRSGMPMAEALRRCPNAVIVHGDMRKYIDVSRRIFRICSDFTDLLEVYSVDECFMDVTLTQDHFGGANAIAREVKRRIREELGLTCSVGIGPNKILAKLAAGLQKPDGLVEIRRESVAALLEDMPVGKLHGVGDQVEAHLRKVGITTAGALGRTPVSFLRREFGIYGEILQAMGRGTYDPPVVPYYESPEVKSVGHSHTMSANTRDWDTLCRNILRLSEMVGRRLRERGLAGRTVALVLRYSDMHTFSRRRTLSEHLDDGYAIYGVATSILREQIDDKRAVRLVGVSVSNLTKEQRQLNLFVDDRSRKVLQAMDSINDRYGEFTIRRASLLIAH